MSSGVNAVGNQITTELRMVRDGLKQLTHSVRDAKEAQSQQQKQEPPVLFAELQIPAAIEREQRERDQRHYRVQVWIAVATSLAVIAAAIYGSFAYLQWTEMIGTTDASYESAKIARRSEAVAARAFEETRKSADAAKSAAHTADATLKASQKSFEIDERPYFVAAGAPGFVPPSNGGIGFAPGKIRVTVFLKNIGRSPALKTVLQHKLVVVALPQPISPVSDAIFAKFRSTARQEKQRRRRVGNEEDKAPQEMIFTTADFDLSEHDFEAVQSSQRGEAALYFMGLILYSDRFGNEYETDLCYLYWGNSPTIWHSCDFYNIIR